MKRIIKSAVAAVVASVLFISCNEENANQEFWLGADLGWITEYEALGYKFYNRNGQEMECTALMKELGLNAVRHRVWVDPSKYGNWCSKEDLLVKCQRAKALDMEILLDFHYSDWWADPAKQNIPAAWSGHSYEQMKQDLWDHTVDVLNYLKDNDITPKWIQVGNETRNGFLWSVKSNELGWPIVDENGNTTITESMGHVVNNPEQYAGFFSIGYDACKSVFPESIVMVHLDNGFDKDLYDFNLGVLAVGDVDECACLTEFYGRVLAGNGCLSFSLFYRILFIINDVKRTTGHLVNTGTLIQPIVIDAATFYQFLVS